MRAHVVIALENQPYPYDRRVRQEAESLVRAGYDVTVCSPTGLGRDATQESIGGVQTLRYPAVSGGRSVLGYAREYVLSLVRLGRLMRRVSRERRVDVVLVCTPPDLTVLPALPLRKGGAALIFDHHDLSPELFEHKFGRRRLLQTIVRRVERFALRRADVVIASNATYAEIERRRAAIDPQRQFVVRNGPDPGTIYPDEPRPQLKRGRRHMVCWIGMMAGGEGLHVLLDAAEELVYRRNRDDIAFAIVGPGDYREDLMHEARRRGLGGAIDFPGLADDARLRAYMSTADVCVSTYEPSAMNHASTVTKVIEYMAMGRPIVQFPLRETSGVCGEASAYAEPGDASDFADRIVELLDDPRRAARMGAFGRARVLEGLQWPDQVPALLKAVETAIQVRAGRR
jgi:glycosyltransferase involved in cell wall biosynthesis